MTFAPLTLQALASLWTGHGGVNLGIVGDTAHLDRGVSYHLGKQDLLPDAYSIKTARDKAGLSNAASAIDLGKLGGSYVGLRAFSVWLVAQARTDGPGTGDMREIIYSPDGQTVLRWDRERGYASAPQTGEADTSHLTHTHISWYRDAETRDHRTAFLPYFQEASVLPIKTDGLFDVALTVGDQLYDLDYAPLTTVSVAQTATGYFNSGTGWLCVRVVIGGTPQAVLVKTSAVTFQSRQPAVQTLASVPAPVSYDVVVGGKPVGAVTLP